MTESTTPNEPTQDTLRSHQVAATFVYALQGLAVILIFTSVVGLIINYLKKDEVKGTWVESHFDWQIKTFWWVVAAYLILVITALIMSIGFVVFDELNPMSYYNAVGTLFLALPGLLLSFGFTCIQMWFLYRVVRGWINLASNKPM